MEGKLPLSLDLMLFDLAFPDGWIDHGCYQSSLLFFLNMDAATLGTLQDAQGDIYQVISFRAVSTLVKLCCLGLELSMSCRLKALDTTIDLLRK